MSKSINAKTIQGRCDAPSLRSSAMPGAREWGADLGVLTYVYAARYTGWRCHGAAGGARAGYTYSTCVPAVPGHTRALQSPTPSRRPTGLLTTALLPTQKTKTPFSSQRENNRQFETPQTRYMHPRSRLPSSLTSCISSAPALI